MEPIFKIHKTIAAIGEKHRGYQKLLTLTSWRDKKPKLDFRPWRKDEDGAMQPARGVSITREEAAELAAAINDYLAKTDDGKDGAE